MNLLNLRNTIVKGVNVCGGTIIKHAPEILTVVGIVSWGGAVVSAVKGTLKCQELLEAKKEELGKEELSAKETAPIIAKCAVPTVLLAVGGTACLVESLSIEQKGLAALTATIAEANQLHKEYKAATVETVGEKKAEKIQELADDKKAVRHLTANDILIANSGEGVLCMEALTGQFFRINLNKLKELALNLRRDQMNSFDQSVTYAGWLSDLGLMIPEARSEDYWDANNDYDFVEVDLSKVRRLHSQYNVGEEGTPYIVVDYNVYPRAPYMHLNGI